MLETPEIPETEDTWKLPFADLFRPLTEAEEGRLRASIKAHGVKHHVLTFDSPTWGTDCVVDGANRLRIGQEEGKEVPVTKIPGLSDDAARDLAITLNADRRHLTIEEQMAARAARVERVAEARSEGDSLPVIADREGISVAQVQRDLEKAKDSGLPPGKPEPEKVKGKDGKEQAAKHKTATPAPQQSPVPATDTFPLVPPASPPQPYPKPEDTPRDALGRALPKYLLDTFAKRNEVRAVSATIGKAASGIKALDGDEELGGFARKRPHLTLDLSGVSDWLRTRLAPYAVCPCCDGDGDSGRCPSCGGRGWVTKAGFRLLSPEAQEKAKSYKPTDTWEPSDDPPTECECDAATEPARRFAAPGVDARDTPIPKHLRDLFEPDFLLDAIHNLKRLECVLQDAKSWLAWLRPEALERVAQLQRDLADACPHEVCLACGGTGRECGQCLTSGYLPKWSCEAGHNKPAAPPETKSETAKAKPAAKKTTPEKKPVGKGGRRGAA